MKWSMFVGALVLSVSLCTSQHSYGFELLDRMLGVGCGCDTCGCDAAPDCGCDTGCDAAPAGCDAKPNCGCEKKSCCKSRCCGGLMDFLHGLHCHRGCCVKKDRGCGCDSGCDSNGCDAAPACGCDAAKSCGCDKGCCKKSRCCKSRCCKSRCNKCDSCGCDKGGCDAAPACGAEPACGCGAAGAADAVPMPPTPKPDASALIGRRGMYAAK